ncbi:anti-sigma factor [Pedobacter sp. HMWF019]|uniref:FecR family protein n=1 Tax=Pedobacter sp. HMWF019 TaxID=2056856 RepID=UPI000D39B940|nr:FecR family protein [Pedobacter sp. HMWF019]PTT04177.1 anti-sigma factor [Pedobacter sp. HMWF019]
MNHKEATLLLEKYNKGTATDEEIRLLENWYNAESLGRKFTDDEADLDRLKEEIWEGTLKRSNLTSPPCKSKIKSSALRIWGYSISAAAVIAMCLGILFIQRSKHRFAVTMEIANHISGGSNKATLTLANGRTIVLSDAVKGKLAEEAGVNITKTADGQLIYEIKEASEGKSEDSEITHAFNIISTARGEEYQVVLPDGSKIWLNAESSLKYPTSFKASADRRVELIGEAYFEIAKDKAHPFKVKTKDQEVEVLGTHFNINSYAENGGAKTTLLEGSVKVSPLGNGQHVLLEESVFLKPGEQSVHNAGSINVVQADLEQAVSWKEGWFYYKSTSLENVLREASRWYNLEVVYKGSIPADRFTGKVPRNASLGKFIKVLELSDIKFRIEGRKMLVN